MTTAYAAHLEWIPDQPLTADQVEDRLLDGDTRGTSLAIGHGRISATFSAIGADPAAALADAVGHATTAVPGRVVAAEILTLEEHDRRLEQPVFPELVGIAEIAELLGVTRQRASALQTNPRFPAPIAVLRSGPVWRRGDLTRFEDTWERKPGRPAKATA